MNPTSSKPRPLDPLVLPDFHLDIWEKLLSGEGWDGWELMACTCGYMRIRNRDGREFVADYSKKYHSSEPDRYNWIKKCWDGFVSQVIEA